MNIPIDTTTFVTTVGSSAFIGLAVACGRLWFGAQTTASEIGSLKAEVAAMKIAAAAQGAELRTVSDALASISTDLRWIKERLNAMPH